MRDDRRNLNQFTLFRRSRFSSDQARIIPKYNMLIDELRNAGIHLNRLNADGYCSGLTENFILAAYQQSKEEFYNYLKFIDSLTAETVKSLVERYTKGDKKDFWIRLEGSEDRILMSKLLRFVEGVSKSQEYSNSSLNSIHANWDRTVSFMCGRKELTTKLKDANIAIGDLLYVAVGNFHAFAIERTKDGFYVFEPNNLKEPQLLKSEKEVSKEILQNIEPFMSDDRELLLGMCFLSFGDKNRELDDALVKIKDNVDVFKPLIDSYYHGQISRLDLALALRSKMSSPTFQFNEELMALNNLLQAFIEKCRFTVPSITTAQAKSPAYSKQFEDFWLIAAVQLGQMNCVELLLNKGADPNCKEFSGRDALSFAVVRGHIDMAALLLEQGANPNAVNVHGETPLQVACKTNQLDMVKLLLLNGAEPEFKNILGGKVHALILAAKEGRTELVSLLMRQLKQLPQSVINSALKGAINNNHIEIVNLLMLNQPINLQEALSQAIQVSRPALANLFLEKGADINFVNKDILEKCLFRASITFQLNFHGREDQAEELLNNIEFKNFICTPLGHALVENNKEMVKLLIERGAARPESVAGFSLAALADAIGHSEIGDYLRGEQSHSPKLQ